MKADWFPIRTRISLAVVFIVYRYTDVLSSDLQSVALAATPFFTAETQRPRRNRPQRLLRELRVSAVRFFFVAAGQHCVSSVVSFFLRLATVYSHLRSR